MDVPVLKCWRRHRETDGARPVEVEALERGKCLFLRILFIESW